MSALATRPIAVSVVGAGSADAATMELARRVGRAIALSGAVVVCGGLGGVMEGACRGAAEAGGSSLALLPGSERSAANPYATLVVPTGLGHARNVLVVSAGEAVVALPGEMGTLSEVALALKIGRPVVAIGAWEGIAGVERAADPESAVAWAIARAKEAR